MTPWLVIIAVGVGTYALRASMLLLVGAKPLPPGIESGLALVGPAAIAALLVSMTITHAGVIDPRSAIDLVAVGAGFVAVRRTGNVLHAFTVGLPIVWLAGALG